MYGGIPYPTGKPHVPCTPMYMVLEPLRLLMYLKPLSTIYPIFRLNQGNTGKYP